MINNSESSTTLTDEQQKSLDAYGQRLFNLQNEIAIATRSLAVLKADSLVAQKDREYQEDLLKEAKDRLDSMNSEVGGLEGQKSILLAELYSAREELAEVTSTSDRKMSELTEMAASAEQRETKIAESESKLKEDQESHRQAKAELEERADRITRAING